LLKKKINLKVDSDGIRLDFYLSKKLNISRSQIQKIINKKNIFINNHIAKSSYIVKSNDIINGDIQLQEDLKTIIPEKINLDIIFEDTDILVINKAAHIIVHPGNGNPSGTLANGIAHYLKLSPKYEDLRVGIVHRLDKETSGLMVVAKNTKSHEIISKQFADRLVTKKYYAIVWGRVLNDSGSINTKIIRDKKNRVKFNVSKTLGRDSITKYKIIKRYKNFTFIELSPKTGRTHQLRVHMKFLGHPIICDSLYNGGEDMFSSYDSNSQKNFSKIFKFINRVALHAFFLQIIHPITNKNIKFNIDLTEDLKKVLNILDEK